MRRFQTAHKHPCQVCGAATPCTGQIAQNYDGCPEWICSDFHLEDGTLNPHFLCSMCHEAQLDAEEAAIKHRALVVQMALALHVPASALVHTHACEWDAAGRGLVRAFCGALIKRTEHAHAPSCRTCAAVLAERNRDVSAEDVFGPPSVGTQVKSLDFDPTRVTPERRVR